METLTAIDVSEFRVRGNYLNQHSPRFRKQLRVSHEGTGMVRPGYSPPVVDFVLRNGAKDTVVVHEIDIPVLCDEQVRARQHLAMILSARQGDHRAAEQ